MNELIPKNQYGVFADTKDTARVDSLYVAECFEKEHFQVLRDIVEITDTKSGLSKEFTTFNFEPNIYKDKTGRKLPCYYLTRYGFNLLSMGYTGQKAMKFKEQYISSFNEVESFIKALVSARREFPFLTESIHLLHEHPKPYHFSDECDMLNCIVTGMPATQFRAANGIEKGESIRPYLSDDEIAILETLQKVDVGLLLAVPEYEQRKRYLEWYMMKTIKGE